ncbi:MAG: endonuclease/exonuclease/phosphatase family protein, partial [Rhodococcus sp. (in: high G+C Gram-positive bacteria)]
EERRHDGFIAELLSARVAVPGAASVLVFAVHTVPPWPREPRAWFRELALLRALLDKVPEGDGPVIVSGDFNATYDHKRFRRLMAGRFEDAAVAVGAGSIPTYAADRWYPSIIAIDHVLVAEATVIGVGAVTLPGSDHRGVRARIQLA